MRTKDEKEKLTKGAQNAISVNKHLPYEVNIKVKFSNYFEVRKEKE